MTNNKGPDDYQQHIPPRKQCWYILKWRKPILANIKQANKLLGDINKKRIRITYIKHNNKTIMISTVFLCLDHGFGYGLPLLFETITYDGEEWGDITRCSTWYEALNMHRERVNHIRGLI